MTNKEAIERLNLMQERCCNGYDYDAEALDLAIKALERPQGEWLNGDDKCSCCGKSKFQDLDADIWADWQPNYCPNCGAKMSEGADNE